MVDKPDPPTKAVAADTQMMQDEAGDGTQTDDAALAVSDMTQTHIQPDAADATQKEEDAAEDSTQTFAEYTLPSSSSCRCHAGHGVAAAG